MNDFETHFSYKKKKFKDCSSQTDSDAENPEFPKINKKKEPVLGKNKSKIPHYQTGQQSCLRKMDTQALKEGSKDTQVGKRMPCKPTIRW